MNANGWWTHEPYNDTASYRTFATAKRPEKQGARNALRRTGPLVRTRGRGTARRAPTEILEQHRPHQIAPVFSGSVSFALAGPWLSYPSAVAKDFLLQQS